MHGTGGADGASLSLVIPAFNEADGIAEAIAEADEVLARLASSSEILIVDDGSQDDTFAVASAAARGRPNVRVLRHECNRGYGAALRTGFMAARGELVAFTDADCQFDLTDLGRLIPQMESADVVTGFRLDRQDPWRRRFLSRGYNLLVRALLGTGVRDCDCALKVFRRDALRKLLPESAGFFANTEMFARARALGLRVAEVGVSHRPRRAGLSKVSLREVPRTLSVLLPFWWRQTLFAQVPSSAPFPRREAIGLALVLVVAAVLFFCRLGTPLLEPEEARYAEIPRQMLAGGSWLLPELHGQEYLDKPPLLYWLVMVAYHLFGVHDWAARLVPGLAGWLTVLVVWAWGRHMAGPRAALLAALILALEPEFVYRGRMLTMNGLLALWVTLGWACLQRSTFNVQRSTFKVWFLLAGIAAGFGLLTKGPVALALIVPPLLAASWLDRRLARPGLRAWLSFGLAAAVVAGPWYVAVAVREPGFAGTFFWFHNVRRFLAPFDHEEPAWFYLPGLAVGLLPWSLLLPGLVTGLFRRSARAAARRPAALGVALLAGGWTVLFFSLSGCKRPVYLVPALPALALALGCHLDAILPRERLARFGAVLWRVRSRLAYAATLVALTAGLGLAAAAGFTAIQKPVRATLLAGAAGIGLALLAQHRPRRLGWGWAATATALLLIAGTHELLPGYARKFSLRYQVRGYADAGPQRPVICYPRRWDSVSFYLDRDDVAAYSADRRSELIAALRARPDALLFVKTRQVGELVRDLPPGLEFVPQSRRDGMTVGWVGPRQAMPIPNGPAPLAARPTAPLLSLPPH